MRDEEGGFTDARGTIKTMSENHIEKVAGIHIEAFSGDFLPSLGIDFLRALYKGILEGDQGFGFVYEVENKIVGFIVGSKDTNKLFRDVIKRKWSYLSLALLKNIIRKPSSLPKIFETFLYPTKDENGDDVRAELMVIAIEKGYRGKKIGERLVESLNKGFLKDNIYKYKVVVYKDNDIANKFYRAMGFRFHRSSKLYKKASNIYTLDLSEMK